MDFDKFLKKLQDASLSKKDFTNLAGIGDNLVKGWATKRQGRKTQPWVESWLNLYISNKEKDIAIKILKN